MSAGIHACVLSAETPDLRELTPQRGIREKTERSLTRVGRCPTSLLIKRLIKASSRSPKDIRIESIWEAVLNLQ